MLNYGFNMYRSPVKEWQVSWFVLETITLNVTDTTAKQLDRHVKTFKADSSAIFANSGICAIQSYCPQHKTPALPLFYWRPVLTFSYICTMANLFNVFIYFHNRIAFCINKLR